METQRKERYKIKITDFKNVSIEDAKFMFQQVEKKLEESSKIADLITARTYSVITIIVGLLVGISGYSISTPHTLDSGSNIKLTLAILLIIGLVACLYFLIKNIVPTKYYSPGSVPDELCINDFFIDGIEKELRTVYIYISEIENYKNRIDINAETNMKRQFRLRNCLIALFIIPILLLGLYVGSLECGFYIPYTS